jgi:hypothetical protein
VQRNLQCLQASSLLTPGSSHTHTNTHHRHTQLTQRWPLWEVLTRHKPCAKDTSATACTCVSVSVCVCVCGHCAWFVRWWRKFARRCWNRQKHGVKTVSVLCAFSPWTFDRGACAHHCVTRTYRCLIRGRPPYADRNAVRHVDNHHTMDLVII